MHEIENTLNRVGRVDLLVKIVGETRRQFSRVKLADNFRGSDIVDQTRGSFLRVKFLGHSHETNLWIILGVKFVSQICGSNSWVKSAGHLRLFGSWNWLDNCLIVS